MYSRTENCVCFNPPNSVFFTFNFLVFNLFQNDHSIGTAPFNDKYTNPDRLGAVATSNTGCACEVKLLTLHKEVDGIG